LEKAHRRLWETSVQVTAVAIEPLLRRLARSARDFAQTQGKEVDVAVDAAGIRIEKTMLEALADPLMQLVQYAVDSGIELPDDRRVAGKPVRGRLMLSAVEVGSKLRITIGDDGRGIDKTRVLSSAMERGLLTAEDAAGLCDREIYGLIFKPRGQAGSARAGGIEGVAARVQELSGAIEVRTTIGRDCHVVVTIPLAAVLLRTLLVRAAEQVFALPERQIICVADADSDDIERVDGQSYYRCRDVAVPLHPLDRLLGFARPDDGRNDGRKYGQIVILSTGTHLIGVHLDEVLRLEDLYLKELHPMLAALPAVAGTAVLGSGRAVLVLDAKGLLELSRPSADKSAATGS
jgi:two-component system chemotaxis sensor kinase CheA